MKLKYYIDDIIFYKTPWAPITAWKICMIEQYKDWNVVYHLYSWYTVNEDEIIQDMDYKKFFK